MQTLTATKPKSTGTGSSRFRKMPRLTPEARESVFNLTCEVECLYGTCMNTFVYAQINQTTPNATNWTNISSTGTIILGTGASNPYNLGNVSGLANATFLLNGTYPSINNLPSKNFCFINIIRLRTVFSDFLWFTCIFNHSSFFTKN